MSSLRELLIEPICNDSNCPSCRRDLSKNDHKLGCENDEVYECGCSVVYGHAQDCIRPSIVVKHTTFQRVSKTITSWFSMYKK